MLVAVVGGRDQGCESKEGQVDDSLAVHWNSDVMWWSWIPNMEIKRWTFFHLTTTTSCVSLLFFQYLPYDIISNTNLIPESGAQSLGDSATGLFCCLTLVIYWPPWFTGLVGSRCVLFRESKARIYLYFISPFSREFRLSYRNIGGPRQWWGTPRD